eukprot:COSAG02_NODE_33556_length_498_cov_0.824561_1_plen_30_part_10
MQLDQLHSRRPLAQPAFLNPDLFAALFQAV